jgi:hypothetical protein
MYGQRVIHGKRPLTTRGRPACPAMAQRKIVEAPAPMRGDPWQERAGTKAGEQ